MTYSKSFFGVSEDADFDLGKAVEAYEWVLANPDEAPFVASMVLLENTSRLMEANSGRIEEVTKRYVTTRLEDARRGLSRSVSKAAGDTLAIVELISKAAGDTYTTWERQEDVKRQMRDARGRFRVMNRPITKTTEKRPLDSQTAQKLLNLNVKLSSHGVDPKTAAVYQRDYQQVTQAMRELADSMGDSANTYVQATYSDGSLSDVTPLSTAISSTTNGQAEAGLLPVSTYKEGNRVVRIEGVADQNMANPGRMMGMDALTAMTRSPGFADFATSAGEAFNSGERAWRDRWNQAPDEGQNTDQFNPGNRFWRRLGASSKLAYDMGGKYLPPKMQMALKVGEWAGNYQPEAERVLGPAARRAAYRFRGTERTPNPVYQNEIDFLRQTKGSGYEAHKALVGGYARPVPGKRADSGMKEDVTPSRTVQAMKALLPDLGLYELNRKSGTIPPSQGIIIDRKGEVVSESVGYGEDWYVPFDLKNLSKLKGGEYIRTRAFGGLTSEDIYVGLVSGARAVTVVSHSGVYTMEFDDNFRGARRYNDKAARMGNRYEQLLDAVKSGKVSLSEIPGDSLEEIRQASAAKSGSPSRTGERYEKALEEGIAEWKRDPSLSAAAKEKIAWDAINQHLVDKDIARNIDDYTDRATALAERRGENPEEERRRLAKWESAADAVGATDRVKKEIEKETIRLEQSVNPLKLNGRGYDLALQALQQQFPYYISDVKHTPWAELGGVTDQGYVKPRFIRPEAARAGYYDPTINGRGKFGADRLYYQNSTVKRPKGAPVDDDDDTEGPASPGAPKAAPKSERPAPVNIEEDRNKNTMALIRKIKAQKVFGPDAPGANAGAGVPSGIAPTGFGGLGVILGNTEDDLRAMLNDSTKAGEVRAALKEIQNKKFFDLSDEDWNATSVGRRPVPDSNMDFLAGIGVRDYVIKDVDPGRNVAYYEQTIAPFLNVSYNPVTASLGITMESTAAEVAEKVKQRAGLLRTLQQAHERVKNGQDLTTSNITRSEDEIRREAMDLATLHAAFKYRDEAAQTEKDIADAAAALNQVEHVYEDENGNRMSPPGDAPKADAPGEGAEAAAMVKRLKAAAEPYRAEIASMVGMDGVVDQLDMLIAQAAAAKRREALGMEQPDRPMSMVFAGNPGTGKTTVAEKIAPMYYELGLTKEPTFLELTKQNFVGDAANNIATNTIAQLEQGKGGVIFIDEAYTLNTDDYGREAIDAMIPWMSKNQDTVFIFAGYPKEMAKFRDETNPGMKSRLSTVINFRDYTPAEMVQIADRMMDKGEYKPTAAARKRIEHAIAQIAASKEFEGNGRDVASFLGRVQSAQNLRLLSNMQLDRAKEAEIIPSDVDHAIKQLGLPPAPRGRKKAA